MAHPKEVITSAKYMATIACEKPEHFFGPDATQPVSAGEVTGHMDG